MSSEAMCKEFEAAYDSGEIYKLEISGSVNFEDHRKQCAWAAWQASRASEIPLADYLPTPKTSIERFGTISEVGNDLQFELFSIRGDGELGPQETILRLAIGRLVSELDLIRSQAVKAG